MKALTRAFVVVGAVTLVASVPLLADQAPSPSPTQAPQSRPAAPPSSAGQAESQTASGELVSIDTKEKTLTVKTATGEMKFSYNDATTITGGKDAAGLATMSGSEVSVQYKKDGASNLATSINVKAAAGAARP